MTVFVNLLQAVAVGMVLASILFMKKMSDLAEGGSSAGSVAEFALEEKWGDELNLSEFVQKRTYIKHFDGPIFFGFAAKFQQMTAAFARSRCRYSAYEKCAVYRSVWYVCN